MTDIQMASVLGVFWMMFAGFAITMWAMHQPHTKLEKVDGYPYSDRCACGVYHELDVPRQTHGMYHSFTTCFTTQKEES